VQSRPTHELRESRLALEVSMRDPKDLGEDEEEQDEDADDNKK
jgi:hypothetical protein